MTSSSTFFCYYRVFYVNFNYWSKSRVDIMTGFGVITIFVYKGLHTNAGWAKKKKNVPKIHFRITKVKGKF